MLPDLNETDELWLYDVCNDCSLDSNTSISLHDAMRLKGYDWTEVGIAGQTCWLGTETLYDEVHLCIAPQGLHGYEVPSLER
jgi:hypothetical protein|tara:strand:+ start:775 stop:1020 length:246 start_codon:yes stop_codon:yes gene_type:complete